MDEDGGVGVGPAARAQNAGADGPTVGHRRRMSARRKQAAVVRLPRGEDLELLSRELGVTAAELSGWRDAFLAGGAASLKSRPADARDAEIGRLKEKVGDPTIARSSAAIHVRRNQGQEALAGPTSCSGPRSSGWRFPAPWPAGGRGDEPAGLARHWPDLWPGTGD